MTTIKASCPVCGDVSLTPPQVRVIACTRPEWSSYAFTCPTCQDEISKPADEEIVTLLISGGVTVEHWVIPAEALEEHLAEMLGRQNTRAFSLDRAGANANRVHLVGKLAHQIEMKTRRAESLDRAMRSHHHTGALHRILKVVVFKHGV